MGLYKSTTNYLNGKLPVTLAEENIIELVLKEVKGTGYLGKCEDIAQYYPEVILANYDNIALTNNSNGKFVGYNYYPSKTYIDSRRFIFNKYVK